MPGTGLRGGCNGTVPPSQEQVEAAAHAVAYPMVPRTGYSTPYLDAQRKRGEEAARSATVALSR